MKLKTTREFSIADRPNFENLIALLLLDGSMCPKCGYGTRKTSKYWRQCKQCGERIHLIPVGKEFVGSSADKSGLPAKIERYF
jgi:hypothetical protein